MMPFFTQSVGVAPGTSTFHLGACPPELLRYRNIGFDPNIGLKRTESPWLYGADAGTHLGAVDTRAHIRWDLIATIGGIALLTSLAAGLIASAIK